MLKAGIPNSVPAADSMELAMATDIMLVSHGTNDIY